MLTRTHTQAQSNKPCGYVALSASLPSNFNQSHFLQQLRLPHSNWSDRPSNNNIITHSTSFMTAN